MARYIAKNIVAAGIADRCQVQLAYAIGREEPVSVYLDCSGTSRVDEALEKIVATTRPAPARNHRFAPVAASDLPGDGGLRPLRPGREGFTWEQTDRAARLRADCGLT
jgi:S-adenosylmethionine synthetase